MTTEPSIHTLASPSRTRRERLMVASRRSRSDSRSSEVSLI
jgi:hypothetical protein